MNKLAYLFLFSAICFNLLANDPKGKGPGVPADQLVPIQPTPAIDATEINRKISNNEYVYYEKKTIKGDIIIGNPWSPSNTTVLQSDIVLKECVIEGKLQIANAVLMGKVDLYKSKIRKETDIHNGRFINWFNMSNLLIRKNLRINGSIFQGGARFSEAEILGETFINDTHFAVNVFFTKAHFHKKFEIYGAYFPAQPYAVFENTIFESEKVVNQSYQLRADHLPIY